ncbi:MAG: 2-oxo acid dehydrogenase subunit E2, partial [Planctomycetaceae bacterium]|nr:2-oxo acid dehydrogenase subunit E2 [Planctomycetaceae bacterium]
LARKIARESQVDLARIRGSGPGGRVVRSDVEAFLEARAKQPAAPAATPSPAAPARKLAAERIPHTRMRKTIAQRMVEAKKVAPEIHVAVDARVDELVAIRERLNARLAAEEIKLSLGDFVTKAVALALRRHPGINASFEPDAIVRHSEINIGIGVAVEAGVLVPVLRNADTLGLREIRRESEALVEAARKGKLTTEQMTGGTFTISNLGMYGVRQFDAILNLPEVAILAVGAAEKRPVVVGDALQVGTVMTLNLTADHRAIDGAMAAEFQRTLKGLLEDPASMLL